MQTEPATVTPRPKKVSRTYKFRQDVVDTVFAHSQESKVPMTAIYERAIEEFFSVPRSGLEKK